MEFNPQIYRRNGTYDMLMCDLMSCFSEFVCMESYCDGDWIMKPIKNIEKIAEGYNYKLLNIVLR